MRNRALIIFFSALIVLSAFFFTSHPCWAEKERSSQFITQPAVVSAISGKAKVLPKEAHLWQKAKTGIKLREGDKIKTQEASKAQLTLRDGSIIRLKEKTTLRITTARQRPSDQSIQYNLDFRVGEIMLQLKKLKSGSSFEVHTPTAVAAVRGTIFYMRTGCKKVGGRKQCFTDLYLDSDDIVNFLNSISGESNDVHQGEGSTSYGDGTTDKPQPLSPSAQDAWKSGWGAADTGSPKGMRDVDEEEGGDDDVGDDVDDTTNDQNNSQENAWGDRIGEQETTNPVDNVGPDRDGDGIPDIEDAFPDDNTIHPDTILTNIDEQTITVRGYGSEDDLRQAAIDNLLTIAGLHNDIGDMLNDIQVRQFDALKEQIFDHQSAKVMTDYWGNRVRVEEYISNPTSDQVQVLALNLRTAGPNAGISSFDFRVKFNQDITGTNLKSLPWGDYMDNPLVGDIPEVSPEDDDYEQLIVYKDSDGRYYDPIAAGYPIPKVFSVEVKNPYRESLMVTEDYSDVDEYLPADILGSTVWAQAQISSEIYINGRQYSDMEFESVDDWGTGWNAENRFTFLEYYENDGEGAWLLGAFFLIDDNGNLIQGVDGDYLDDGELSIEGIRDCINPEYNLEMVFLSSEFGDTPWDIPEQIDAGDITDEFTLYNYPGVRSIDVITIPEITTPYDYVHDSPIPVLVTEENW